MKKLALLIILLFTFSLSNVYVAQTGGRKREHKNQKGGSKGFSRSSGRKGVFARMFRKDKPAWVYHSTKSGRAQVRETRHLFSRYRTKGKRYKDGILAKQNAERARKRVKGNSTFHHRRYT